MANVPKRRWFQFSLLATLLLTTALALWIGWAAIVLRGRRAAWNYANGQGADFDVAGASDNLLRRMLGDIKITRITISKEESSSQLEALVRRKFPEAKLAFDK